MNSFIPTSFGSGGGVPLPLWVVWLLVDGGEGDGLEELVGDELKHLPVNRSNLVLEHPVHDVGFVPLVHEEVHLVHLLHQLRHHRHVTNNHSHPPCRSPSRFGPLERTQTPRKSQPQTSRCDGMIKLRISVFYHRRNKNPPPRGEGVGVSR